MSEKYYSLLQDGQNHSFTYVDQKNFYLDHNIYNIDVFESALRGKTPSRFIHRINNLITALRGFAEAWGHYSDQDRQTVTNELLPAILKFKQPPESKTPSIEQLWRVPGFGPDAPDYIWDDQARLYDLVMRFLGKE